MEMSIEITAENDEGLLFALTDIRRMVAAGYESSNNVIWRREEKITYSFGIGRSCSEEKFNDSDKVDELPSS